MGVLRPLKVVIENYPEGQSEELDAVNNPEDASAGTRKVPFSRVLYIEQDDFREDPPKQFFRLSPGREVRLRYGRLGDTQRAECLCGVRLHVRRVSAGIALPQVRDCAHGDGQPCIAAHALAYERIHRLQPDASVGLATNWVEFQAATNSAADRLLEFLYDAAFNRSSLQLLRCGSLPFPFGSLAPEVPEVMGKIDFVGLNVYNRLHVRTPWDEASRKTGGVFVPRDVPQGDHGVELPYGEAFPDGIVSAAQEYAALKVPLYVMENGVPDRTDRIRPWVLVQSCAAGTVADRARHRSARIFSLEPGGQLRVERRLDIALRIV